MQPKYDLDKIKYATDAPTFEKAIELYEKKKVTRFKNEIGAYSAIVLGTQPYRVSIEARRYDYGNCECYLGQNETLCKHMVAVAIHAVKEGGPLTNDDKRQVSQASCSGKLGVLTKVELSSVKKSITSSIRYIKAYDGPSRTWFAYQNSLSEGCNHLTKIVSELPVSEQTTKLIVNTLLRIDDKLCQGGVDDSDGTVGNFIMETVEVLKKYVELDSSCVKSFQVFKDKRTCFDWEKPLLAYVCC